MTELMTKPQTRQSASTSEQAVIEQVIQTQEVEEFVPPLLLSDVGDQYRTHMTGKEAFDSYVESEIDRVLASGAPLLSNLLRAKSDSFRGKALEIFHAAQEFSEVRLVLVPGVTPPDRDYNGALVPLDKRGKVLAAKVGLTADLDTRHPEKYAAKNSAINEKIARRTYMSPLGRYRHLEIGLKPITVPAKVAVALLTRYGWGIAAKESFWFIKEV